ncbi:hypothetical protein C0583_01625 [Candidatus Parcubacteria bacterium]|nr:MAG: hypothetical protein C0583_01625 [Candidatus Parcubacteria bacterium]
MKNFKIVLGSTVLLIIIFVSIFLLQAKKIDNKVTNDNQSDNLIVQQISKSIPMEEQEQAYKQEATIIVEEYQLFIESLNTKIDAVANSDEVILALESEGEKLQTINNDFSNLIVPKRFKDYHLLMSRSMFLLASYLDTNNPDDMLNGLDLYENAQEELENLSIS